MLLDHTRDVCVSVELMHDGRHGQVPPPAEGHLQRVVPAQDVLEVHQRAHREHYHPVAGQHIVEGLVGGALQHLVDDVVVHSLIHALVPLEARRDDAGQQAQVLHHGRCRAHHHAGVADLLAQEVGQRVVSEDPSDPHRIVHLVAEENVFLSEYHRSCRHVAEVGIIEGVALKHNVSNICGEHVAKSVAMVLQKVQINQVAIHLKLVKGPQRVIELHYVEPSGSVLSRKVVRPRLSCIRPYLSEYEQL